MYNLSFLQEFGLSDIQIKIYNYLLTNKYGNIKQIKNDLNYSYTQIRENLSFLEKFKLIKSSESKPKVFFRIDPKIALTEILKKKNQVIIENLNKLEDYIHANESNTGICTRNITFYHHSDVNTGLEYIHELIEKAEKEILLSSLPPSLLKNLERSLNAAFLRGIKIKIFYSKIDFEEIDNYFGRITDILKDINIEIIEVSEKACRLVRFNDLIVNEGVVLIDHYFNSVLFIEDNFFHFNGFYMPSMAVNVKNMFEAKTCIKSTKINPDPIQNVLKIIKSQPNIKTRELNKEIRVSGTKLREILDYLVNQGLIRQEEIKNEIGRPKKIYSLIE